MKVRHIARQPRPRKQAPAYELVGNKLIVRIVLPKRTLRKWLHGGFTVDRRKQKRFDRRSREGKTAVLRFANGWYMMDEAAPIPGHVWDAWCYRRRQAQDALIHQQKFLTP